MTTTRRSGATSLAACLGFEAETRAARAVRPYEVVVGDYNAMVDNGIDMALLLLVGGAGTAFNNANARLGVGDSATAWPVGIGSVQSRHSARIVSITRSA